MIRRGRRFPERDGPARKGSILFLLLIGAVILSFGVRVIEPHPHDLDRAHDSDHCPICWVAGTPLGAPPPTTSVEPGLLLEAGCPVADPILPLLPAFAAGPVCLRGPPLA